jgi:hypothetical protein
MVPSNRASIPYSPVDLKCQGYPFVQDHPFMIRSIAVAHPRTTTFQRRNLSARSDQMPCSNTAAEALLHLQSSHIQLNAPSRQQAGFQHQNKEAAPLHLPCLFKPIRTPWWKKRELGRVMPFRLDCAPSPRFTRNLSAQ